MDAMKTVAKCENDSEPSLMRFVLSYVERTLRPTLVVGILPDQSWWTGHKNSALASDGDDACGPSRVSSPADPMVGHS